MMHGEVRPTHPPTHSWVSSVYVACLTLHAAMEGSAPGVRHGRRAQGGGHLSHSLTAQADHCDPPPEARTKPRDSSSDSMWTTDNDDQASSQSPDMGDSEYKY